MREIENVDILGSEAGADMKPSASAKLGESLNDIPASHGRAVFQRLRRQRLDVAAFNSSI